MIQVDVPMAFAVGSVLAGAAHRQLASGRAPARWRVQLQANLYHLFFFSWIPIYFTLNYFGWETSHMWWHGDSVAEYPFFIPVFMVALALALNLGFLSGYWLIRQRRQRVNQAIYSAIVVYSILWVVLAGEHVTRLGTYAEFQAGRAPHFADDPAFLRMLIATMILWPGALVAFAVRLLREGKTAGEIVA